MKQMYSAFKYVFLFLDFTHSYKLKLFVYYAGEYYNVNTLTFMRMLHDKYGNIVKFDGLKKQPSIFLFCPELCKNMYQLQGKIPMRIAMEPLHNYRKSRKDIYKGQYGLTTRSIVSIKRI